MIGNRKGWLLASLIAIAYVGFWAFLESSTSATRPTELTATPSRMAPITLAISPDTLLPRDASDGTDLLHQIVGEIQSHQDLYQHFVDTPGIDAAALPRLAVLDLMLQQTPTSTSRLWTTRPREVVAYGRKPEVEAILLAGVTTGRVAAWKRVQKSPDAARALFEAELSLGAKIFDARTSYTELSTGLGLMSEAAAGLRQLAADANNPAALTSATDFHNALLRINDQTRPIWQAISTIDPEVMSRHNGDIPILARSAGERVWRVEATLKLGRMKYDVGTSGTHADQKNAQKLLTKLQSDPDPAIALAAKLASDLTVEEYRALH